MGANTPNGANPRSPEKAPSTTRKTVKLGTDWGFKLMKGQKGVCVKIKFPTCRLPFNHSTKIEKPVFTKGLSLSKEVCLENLESLDCIKKSSFRRGTTNQRSNQLSYIRHLLVFFIFADF